MFFNTELGCRHDNLEIHPSKGSVLSFNGGPNFIVPFSNRVMTQIALTFRAKGEL